MPLATLNQVRKAREQLLAKGDVPTVVTITALLGRQYSVASVARGLDKLEQEAARQGIGIRPPVNRPDASVERNAHTDYERLRHAERDNRSLRDQLRVLELEVIASLKQQVTEQAAALLLQQEQACVLREKLSKTDVESALLRTELALNAHAKAQYWLLQQQLETLYQQRLTYTGSRHRPYYIVWPRIFNGWKSDCDEEAQMEHPAVTQALFQIHLREMCLEETYRRYKDEHPQLVVENHKLKQALAAQQRQLAISQHEIARLADNYNAMRATLERELPFGPRQLFPDSLLLNPNNGKSKESYFTKVINRDEEGRDEGE